MLPSQQLATWCNLEGQSMKPEELAEYLTVMKRQYQNDLKDALQEVKMGRLEEQIRHQEERQRQHDFEYRESQIRTNEHKLLMDQLRQESRQVLEQLISENQQLKEQLALSPANSTFVTVGALIELLTEQKAPRRTQSRIKDELEDKGLKGLSRSSLNDIFSAANKALKASKDAAK